MSKCLTTSWRILTPEQYASSAIKTVGVADEICGHWGHQLEFGVIFGLPEKLSNYVIKEGMRKKKIENFAYLEAEKAKES